MYSVASKKGSLRWNRCSHCRFQSSRARTLRGLQTTETTTAASDGITLVIGGAVAGTDTDSGDAGGVAEAGADAEVIDANANSINVAIGENPFFIPEGAIGGSAGYVEGDAEAISSSNGAGAISNSLTGSLGGTLSGFGNGMATNLTTGFPGFGSGIMATTKETKDTQDDTADIMFSSFGLASGFQGAGGFGVAGGITDSFGTSTSNGASSGTVDASIDVDSAALQGSATDAGGLQGGLSTFDVDADGDADSSQSGIVGPSASGGFAAGGLGGSISDSEVTVADEGVVTEEPALGTLSTSTAGFGLGGLSGLLGGGFGGFGFGP